MSITEDVVELVVSGEIVESLNKGYAATSDTVSDVLDSALQGAVPAYATAMDIAERAGDAAGISIDDVRHKIFREISETIGLASVIRALVDAWHAVPAILRDNIQEAIEVGQNIKALWDDPSWDNLLTTAKSLGALSVASVRMLEKGAELIGRGLAEGAEFLYDYGSRAAEAVASFLVDIGEEAVSKLVSAIYENAGDLVTSGLGISDDQVAGIWKAAKSGDIIAVGEKTAEAVIMAPVNVAEGAVELAGDAWDEFKSWW